MRYQQLIPIIEEIKPRVVVEIGTHKAERPREWANVCDFVYLGFDVFEDGTQALNTTEMNGKGYCTMEQARKNLGDIAHYLFKGLSSETVPQAAKFIRGVDFAFIDGGHSVGTIRKDWENVMKMMRKGGVVVFDDYYTPEKDGFGCNQIVKDLHHTVLPEKDNFGFDIQLVRVDV